MDDDQQFCLRWNNHQSTLVAVFDTLLENGTLVDCTLAAEGKFLNAHKVVLSACSPYFEALLSKHFDKHPILILKDVKFQELKAMMDYMYRGEVNISQDQLGALLKAAESLQIKGLSDNRKGETTERKPTPAPPPPKSPQPTSTLPKVQGLTIEQRARDDSREGSVSPGPRKKKRLRRKSEELDNHDASNSSESHSLPAQNIPTLPAVTKINADVPDQVETKSEILTRHKQQTDEMPQVPIIKEKIETHTELMLEPKSEYVDEMNEDSIEDLTLDDDDLSNMEHMDDGAGPSHGNTGEGSSQGFGGWHMGNQSQDEVFLAAQEAVGAHRDSQDYIPDDLLKLNKSIRFPIIDMSRVFINRRIRKPSQKRLPMSEMSAPSTTSNTGRHISIPLNATHHVNHNGKRVSRKRCKKYSGFLCKNAYKCRRGINRKINDSTKKATTNQINTSKTKKKSVGSISKKTGLNDAPSNIAKLPGNDKKTTKVKGKVIDNKKIIRSRSLSLKRKRICKCTIIDGKINTCSNCLKNNEPKFKKIQKTGSSLLQNTTELGDNKSPDKRTRIRSRSLSSKWIRPKIISEKTVSSPLQNTTLVRNNKSSNKRTRIRNKSVSSKRNRNNEPLSPQLAEIIKIGDRSSGIQTRVRSRSMSSKRSGNNEPKSLKSKIPIISQSEKAAKKNIKNPHDIKPRLRSKSMHLRSRRHCNCTDIHDKMSICSNSLDDNESRIQMTDKSPSTQLEKTTQHNTKTRTRTTSLSSKIQEHCNDDKINTSSQDTPKILISSQLILHLELTRLDESLMSKYIESKQSVDDVQDHENTDTTILNSTNESPVEEEVIQDRCNNLNSLVNDLENIDGNNINKSIEDHSYAKTN